MQHQTGLMMEMPLAEPRPRRVRVVVCGEVNSGKSTVVNVLLRSRVLPDNVGRDCRPKVVVQFRGAAGAEVIDASGNRQEVEGAPDPDSLLNACSVNLFTTHQHLAGIEIIELPLTRVEDMTDADLETVNSADVLVWTTIASQAWRLTEKSIIERFEGILPRVRVLAVTRADKLRSASDRNKIAERLHRETGTLFTRHVFVSGARTALDRAQTNDDSWAAIGGAAILAAIDTVEGRAEAAAHDLAAYEAPARSADIVDLSGVRHYRPASEGAAAPAADTQMSALLLLEGAVILPDDTEDAPSSDLTTDLTDTGLSQPAADETPPDTSADAPATESRPTHPATDAAVAAMQSLSEGLAHVRAVALHRAGDGTDHTLAGDPGVAAAGLDLAKQLAAGLMPLYATATGDTIESISLATVDSRFLVRVLPGNHLLVLVVDAAAMNQGAAQNLMSRLSRPLDPQP